MMFLRLIVVIICSIAQDNYLGQGSVLYIFFIVKYLDEILGPKSQYIINNNQSIMNASFNENKLSFICIEN